jgi:hypothetical protein
MVAPIRRQIGRIVTISDIPRKSCRELGLGGASTGHKRLSMKILPKGGHLALAGLA